MKVGILTYHRAHNYGAVLQCFALQEIIRKQGHEVEIIDYKQPFIEKYYNPQVSFRHVIKLCLLLEFEGLYVYVKRYFDKFKKRKFFNEFRLAFMKCGKPFNGTNIPQDYDTYVLGSDQIWGIHCTNGYDPIYWGNFPKGPGVKVFGYAISGTTAYHKVLSEDEIRSNIGNFNNLSFREETLRDDIAKVAGIHAEIALDPTLLTDAEIWSPLINSEWSQRNYIVLYQVRFIKGEEKMLNRKAKSFAKHLNCEIIDLSDMQYSVEDFVSIIKYAKCVVTSSFHATVFSIIFSTPFYSFKLYDTHDDRYTDLLERLHLSKHVVDKDSVLSEIPFVDRDVIKKYLPLLQESSFRYLKTILS